MLPFLPWPPLTPVALGASLGQLHVEKLARLSSLHTFLLLLLFPFFFKVVMLLL